MSQKLRVDFVERRSTQIGHHHRAFRRLYPMKVCFFMLLLLSLVSYTSPFSIVDSSTTSNNNEINQLLKYISWTSLDEKTLFDEWTDCQNLLSRSYARNWRCVPSQAERIAEMNGTFPKWNRRNSGDEHIPLLPDCKYDISKSHDIVRKGFSFQIYQSECRGFVGPVVGGSSFQVTANLGHSVSFCRVNDYFNGTYGVLCPNVECEARRILSRNRLSVNRLAKDLSSQAICVNVTIILDYEHFDAFSETKSSEPPMRHILSNITNFCNFDVIDSIGAPTTCPVTEYFWMHNYGTHDLSDYEWISNTTNDGSFPQLPTVAKCFANEKISFVIDGQLNMVSNYLEELYIDSNPRGAFRFENVEKNLVLDTVDFFGTNVFPACGKNEEHTFVFEFGNFDLKHTPPRNLISNPLTLHTLLDKVKQISTSDKCTNVKLIWVNLPPVHKCIHSLHPCVHEIDASWSNNYATGAINQFFRNSLLNMSLTSSRRIEIIDRFEILYPRVMTETLVCNSMFVCRNEEKRTIQTTSTFRALVSEIVRKACDILQVDWSQAYSHVDKFYSTKRNDSSVFFYTMKGIRRRIPDEETLEFLRIQTGHSENNSSTILVEQSELSEIPQDPSITAYITREEGTLISFDRDEIYLMDIGLRRPLSKSLLNKHTETLYHILGKDHANVMQISKSDMNIIPLGPPVVNIDVLANVTEIETMKKASDLEKIKNMIETAKITYGKLEPCLRNGSILSSSQTLKYPEDAEGHYYDLLERTSIFRNQPYHYYSGYDGPWIENYFIDNFMDKPLSYFNGMIPLFVQWVDVMVVASDFPQIVKLMREILRPDVLYLAVSQSDKGLEQVQAAHPNILTISAGGWGHIPIPLIKGEVPFNPPPEKFQYDTVFFGNIKQHSRPEAFEKMNKMFPKYNISYMIDTYTKDWSSMLKNTRFPLAPRGFGRSSFRFSEIVQSGRAPIYVYDDYSWLPYSGTNSSIEQYGMSVSNHDSMDNLARRLSMINDTVYREIYIPKLLRLREDFTYSGVIRQIAKFIENPLVGGLLRCTRIPNSQN